MRNIALVLFLATLAAPLPAQNAVSPFLGRWDILLTTPKGALPDWLGVSDKDGTLEVWYQPPGGNVYRVENPKLDGAHLVLNLAKGSTWNVEVAGGKLVGEQTKDGVPEGSIAGVRAPELKRGAPAAWTTPEPLFNGHDLAGWEPTAAGVSHWLVRNGELVNEAKGVNLKTTRKFDDFKLHIEFNCPDDGNSGIYLRGRYEVQVEYEPLTQNPPERRIGSIYGFLTPAADLPRKPGQWESFDVTLIGRTLTVLRNGVTIHDAKEIPGITGGALDPNEGEPGPIYIQGDHTGGLKFRNITIAVPKQ